MADDDKDKEDGFDPWADLETDGGPDTTDGFSFSFEEASLDAGLDEAIAPTSSEGESTPVPPSQLEGEATASTEGGAEAAGAHDDDAFANAWLDESSDTLADPPLSLFSPDEQADEQAEESPPSGTELPQEGIEREDEFQSRFVEAAGDAGEPTDADLDVLALLGDDGEHGGQADALSDADAVFEEPLEEPNSGAEGEVSTADSLPATTEAADVIDFGLAAAGMAAAAAAGSPDADIPAASLPRQSATVNRRTKGGIGQLVGVVVGGLLAIPIVLGILIGLMWMGWRDTVGIRTWMPEQLAFLLPTPATRSGDRGTTGGPDVSRAPSLDDLPAVAIDGGADAGAETPSEEPVAADPAAGEPTEPALDTAAVATAAPDGAGPAMKQESPDLSPVETVSEEPADPFAGLMPKPSLDDLGAPAPADPVMPADASPESDEAVASPAAVAAAAVPVPEPLDLESLEAAASEAAAALEAVRSDPELTGLARKKRLVDWYRRLVRTAEQLALVERVAADSGRPLDTPPAVIVDLGSRVLSAPDLADDLAKLGRDWLGYARREGDGVVLPATFIGTRKVGPFSSSRISLVEADGTSREVAVISRAVPAAVEGDRVLVMGLVMDGGVIWASDLRSAVEAQAAVEPESPAPAEPEPLGLQAP